jgi:hypothetical protein
MKDSRQEELPPNWVPEKGLLAGKSLLPERRKKQERPPPNTGQEF